MNPSYHNSASMNECGPLRLITCTPKGCFFTDEEHPILPLLLL
ncbi:hypothetical protein KNP414_05318 [Paenibacillus mucilaginosus KNP414]|uniref:Uncharacterized protein n=1 Tax=Paenibacillus mucilaginosus (strain KNP414) TaxID=1036673 RepID=F8FE83_PAEMK|nr:hypothetical protein KNP414_05318 [Paenibacillus mucilaginosus KNP414]